MSSLSEPHREKQGLSAFCEDFGLKEEEIGRITKLGRRCFLTLENQDPLIAKLKNNLFGVGVYLGEEKQRFEPSPALLELISAKTDEHKVRVDEKAAWLFVCGRDILEQGVQDAGEPTRAGYLLVVNKHGENLGYGRVPGPKDKKKSRNVYVKNLLDRGFFLRRERLS